jgi:hypothetical protein
VEGVQHIGLLTLAPQQTQTEYTDIPESFLQLAEVQISANVTVASLAVADDDARISPNPAELHTPLQAGLLLSAHVQTGLLLFRA